MHTESTKVLKAFFLTGALFSLTAFFVQLGFFHTPNSIVQEWFSQIANETLSLIAVLIDALTTPTLFIFWVVLASIVLLGRDLKKEFFIFISGITVSSVLVVVFKNVFRVIRPEHTLVPVFSNLAFPSGHTTLITVFLFLFTFLFFNSKKRKREDEFLFLAPALILIIGISRMYLGVHWFSDVLGGLFLGLSISFLMIWVYIKNVFISKNTV